MSSIHGRRDATGRWGRSVRPGSRRSCTESKRGHILGGFSECVHLQYMGIQGLLEYLTLSILLLRFLSTLEQMRAVGFYELLYLSLSQP